MKFKPISLIKLNKIRQSIEEKYNLQIPTYEIKLPNGQKEIHKHDEQSILESSEEEQKEWDLYIEQKQEMEAEINEKSTAYAFLHGIECEIPEDWIDEQAWLGIDLPEDERDLKIMYVTEQLTTLYDIRKAFLDIFKLSAKGVDESTIKAVEGSFLGTLQG